MQQSVSRQLQTEGKPFQPLPKIVLVDDFAKSRSGWYLMYENGEGYELNWGTVTRSSMPTHWFARRPVGPLQPEDGHGPRSRQDHPGHQAGDHALLRR